MKRYYIKQTYIALKDIGKIIKKGEKKITYCGKQNYYEFENEININDTYVKHCYAQKKLNNVLSYVMKNNVFKEWWKVNFEIMEVDQ